MTEESASADQGFEEKFFEIMSRNPKGISHQNLQNSLPTMNAQQLVNCMNKLLAQNKVRLLRRSDQPFYQLIDGSRQQYKGTDIEEKVIFEAIERAGNNGIMPKDLKGQCRLALPQINKILKAMVDKRLIKCVQSTSKKKLYMLYGLEPSETITGGNFYSGQEFETEYVKVLGEQCYKYLLKARGAAEQLPDPLAQRNASYKSSRDICDYINCLKISKVTLTCKDIERILQSLIYDDKIEKIVSISKMKDKGMENLYKVSKPLSGSQGLMMLPCGICKVYKNCHPEGDVSPATCEYMQQWLAF